jgi:hypothetical protein
VKQIRKRLTYANVMSSIAVFLVLGGATALAASQLGKNSVGTKQLKKNAVTAAKIKKNAVTTSKIKNGAVTGAKLNLGTIGKVPSAVHADTADTAGTAGTANSVAGSTIRKFFYATNTTSAKTTLLSLDGLTLTGSCELGTPALIATTSAPALIRAGGTYLIATPFYVEDDTFEPGEEFNLVSEESDSVQGTFTYAQPNGTVVTGVFESEEGGFSTGTTCVVSGHAIG